MGAHLIDGKFQSDKYPECPRGKVPLSCEDPRAQPYLWRYATEYDGPDPEYATDILAALKEAGYEHTPTWTIVDTDNYDGDYPSERFVAVGIQSPARAQVMADALNAKMGDQMGDQSPRYMKVEPEGYKLAPGFEP